MSRVKREGKAIATLVIGLGNLVSEMLPRVSAALAGSIDVYCRVLETTAELFPHDEYRVLGVRTRGLNSSGWLLIETPTAEEESSTWVTCSSVTSLRLGGEDLVRCGFTRLTMDGSCYDDDNEAIVAFTQIVGHHLQRLTLGERDSLDIVLPRFMDSCPYLQLLGLSGTGIYQHGEAEPWSWARHHRNIQAISLNQCFLSAVSATSLLSMLSQSDCHTLRRLDLRVNIIFDIEPLEALRNLFKANRALDFVDIYSLFVDKDTPEELELRACIQTIGAFLHAEYLSAEIRLAFGGVVRHLNLLHLDDTIVQKIFEFTGAKHKRVLRQSKQEPAGSMN